MEIADIFGIQTKPVTGGSKEVIQCIRRILLDESEHIISSLELNRIAFWTYHEASIADGEDMCELVIQLLESILSKPMNYSPLTLQKTLAVTKHVLIYGAEIVVNQAICLGRYVETLLNYNTILLAQKKQGIEGFFLQIKGGGVDRGGPVRDIASSVHSLLSDVTLLQLERSSKADPTSLVPVGSRKAAFVTDEVRLYALKKRMEHEQSITTRSNLAKADNGFGGGYMSRDGTKHVGAAHGIEEMLKLAEKEKQRFSDEQTAISQQKYRYNETDSNAFADYVAPNADLLLPRLTAPSAYIEPTSLPFVADLLSLNDAPPVVEEDLLGLVNLGNGSISPDLLGLTGTNNLDAPSLTGVNLWDTKSSTAPASAPVARLDILWATTALLGTHSPTTANAASTSSTANPFITSMHTANQPLQYESSFLQTKSPMISENTDRFAALDELVAASSTNNQLLTPGGLNGLGGTSLDSLTTQTRSTVSLCAPVTNPVTPFAYSATSLKISEHVGGFLKTEGNNDDDDVENGFIMGGATGSGVLEPTAPAPAVAPPPPPPGCFS
ncbi:hypothetical protein MPSEU_000567800 [Mayamaea pseudoterrestris]|nr:hypothetical protein MPSEU_000567800 [Mayamaea pseudoterrestris]